MVKVLIVDDKEENSYLLQSIFDINDVTCLTAKNGQEALEIMLVDIPDIIVSDVLMPVMDGFTLCRECKKNERLKNIPFVFYTATYTDARDEEYATGLGADRYILKPAEPEEFLSIIKNILSEVNNSTFHTKEIVVQQEVVVLKEYNEVLVRKIEDKMLQCEKAEKEIKKLNETLEHRIEERTSQLEVLNQELEAFTFSVSHDLHAPLRHINGYVNMLNEFLGDSLPEIARHYLDSVEEAAHHMGILIDDLLLFSKTNRQEMKLVNVDMNSVLSKTLQMMKVDTSDRIIEWSIDELPCVLGDENLLSMVWVNLISNAIKFTLGKKPTKIEIGYRKENREFVFFVRDNGAGFDMKYAHRLFGVFQRLHSAQEFEGTGIGLANVRRIIHKHGGRTWAEGEKGKGAVFYFSLTEK